MEFISSHPIFLFGSAIIPFLYLYFHKLGLNLLRNGRGGEKVELPPGTSGFPLVGESLRFYWKIRKGRHYEFVRERMDKYSSKVFRTSLMGQPVAILCGSEGNKFLFTNEQKLVKVWWPPVLDKLFPLSTRHRVPDRVFLLHKTVLPLFLTLEPLRPFLGVMDALMKQHLKEYWTGDGRVIKVGEMSKKYMFSLAWNFFMGSNNQKEIAQSSHEDIVLMEAATMTLWSINLPGTALNRGVRGSRRMRSKIEEIIRLRRSANSSSTDFISHLILAVDENGELFGDGDIACILSGLIMGSYTPLHTLATLVINNLSDLPTVYESVLKEQTSIAALKKSGERLSWEDTRKMKYTWNVVREILRLQDPKIGFKEATSDFTYEGYTIPKGWKMCWMTQATQEDPKYFDNPNEFDPTRFDDTSPAPYAYVPFSGGSRLCPGNEYARLGVLTFVHYVVTQFEWERVNPNEQILHFPLPRPAQGLPIRNQSSRIYNLTPLDHFYYLRFLHLGSRKS